VPATPADNADRRPRAVARALLVAVLALGLVVSFGAQPALAAPANGSSQPSGSSIDQQAHQYLAQLAAINNEFEVDQAALQSLNASLAADQQREAVLEPELARLARLDYERPVLTLSTVLSARSLNQFLFELAQTRLISLQQQHLMAAATNLQREDEEARAQINARLAQLKLARAQLAKIATRALMLRDDLIAREASAMLGGSGAGGRWPNHFFFGQCTWYVATLVDVPWYGNAIQWWANARPYYPEGQTPEVGAIMVTREGYYGHVAFVEAVNPDGSWVVAEMNYVGWDEVDHRTISPGEVPVMGFIYPPPSAEA
jgi:hypothetical protein